MSRSLQNVLTNFLILRCVVMEKGLMNSNQENDGTEREAQGVGWDMSRPQKLFLTQRKSRFSGGSLFSETSAYSLALLSGS